MNLNIYYKTETPEDLKSLVFILDKVGFSEEFINFINIEDENLETLNKDKIEKNVILCINDTYKDISNALCKNRGLPIFEFDSRKYHDHIKKLTVYSIPLTIKDMYSNEHKRNVWNVLVKLKEIYDKYPKPKIVKVETIVEPIPVIEVLEVEPIIDVVETSIVNDVQEILISHMDNNTNSDLYEKIQILQFKVKEINTLIDELLTTNIKTQENLNAI